VSSLFCRHNRFTADCPICSRGTVLDSERRASPKTSSRAAGGTRRARGQAAAPPPQFSGLHVAAGPYEREDGESYEVRLERVPGGVRLASWSRGQLERRAPEVPVADVRALVATAAERELLPAADLTALTDAVRADPEPGVDSSPAASPGRAGDLKEELRIERMDDGTVRIGRWLFYPSRGWELQDAPPMLPASRYAEALRAFFRAGG
jgi:hypothetical protein